MLHKWHRPHRVWGGYGCFTNGRKRGIAGYQLTESRGELLPQHKGLVDYIEQYGGTWWGFTRRVDTHRVLPRLMFSLDATTPGPVMQYVEKEVPVDRRAYLRRPGDPPAPLEVAVTFPTHGPRTRYVADTPADETDCPDLRGKVKGCWDCRRCY